ncbi:MAG: FG-GAP-like repeat-containing protein [Bacteroidia bacterium]
MLPVFSKASSVTAAIILLGLFCANFYDKSSTQLTVKIETEVIPAPDFCNATNNPLPAHTNQDNWLQKVQKDIASREYHINYATDKKYHQSPNRANNTRITYYPQSIQIAPRTLEELEETPSIEPNAKRKLSKTFEDYTLQLEVKGYGTTKKIVHPFQAEKLLSENNEAFAKDEHMRVEYINNEEGTRQNFIINQPIKGNELAVHLNINTNLTVTQENKGSIKFTGKHKNTRLYYNDLKVWDATGKILPAQMKLSNEGQSHALVLAVNTVGAEYPITIDPIVTNGTPINANTLMESNQVDAQMGYSVSSAGDVNGDGYGDVIVGVVKYDNSQTDEGAAFIYHGSATGISSTVTTVLESNVSGAYFGKSVSYAGDVNGDGYSDIIVGAPNYANGQTDEGAFFVFNGSVSGLNTSYSRMVESDQANGMLGISVSFSGDVNGDGYSDVVVGFYGYTNGQTNEGAFMIYHGGASGIGASFSCFVESNQASTFFGNAVACAGDVNGDGYSDVIIGALEYDNGQTDEGAFFIYHGTASGLSTTAALMVESNQASARMGQSVACSGDVNGDGYSDVVIGIPFYTSGQSNEGATMIYHGSSTGIGGSPIITLESNFAGARMGTSVSSAGDVNGDGYADVIVGVPFFANGQTDEGVAYVFHGGASGISGSYASIIESNQAGSNMGWDVSCAGDVNGDGYSDIVTSAQEYANGQTDEGAAFVFHGGASGAHTTQNVLIQRDVTDARFGRSISFAGDVNGDGYSDMIVGAVKASNSSILSYGGAIGYYGSVTGISSANWSVSGSINNSNFSTSISSAGDVNGDGYSDVIVGAYFISNGQNQEGAFYVYHGSATGLSTTPATSVESNLANTWLGYAVAGAGDVNGDGYSDVVVSAPWYMNQQGAVYIYHGSASGIQSTPARSLTSINYITNLCAGGDVNGDGYSDIILPYPTHTNGQYNEGRLRVYHGSPSGIGSSFNTHIETNVNNARLGTSISMCGDINGDGYSDVVCGNEMFSNGQQEEGVIYVFQGSASGLSSTPVNTIESNSAYLNFGASVSIVGDVNGDGYSDVAVGAPRYTNGQLQEGCVYIYHGSTTGISSIHSVILESNIDYLAFGRKISGIDDVNGDGYSDIAIGDEDYDNGQNNEGAAFIYYGNGGTTGRRNNVRLYNTDLSTPIQQSNKTNSNFGLGLYASSAEGRQKVKMVWEVKTQGQPFSSAGGKITNSVSNTSVQSSYSNTGLTGTNLNNLVSKPGLQTKVRCRVQYDLTTSVTGQKYGPWRYPQGYLNGQQGMNSTPLPVEWLSFTAQWLQEGESAQLNWSTASEKNNSHFTLLRSIDGQNWEEVAQVNGAGTTNNISQYTYIDNSLKHLNTSTLKHVYYRLMQTDYNGQFSFSEVRELTLEPQSGISVSPNPGINQVITLNQPAATDLPYTIIDIQGKEVGKGIIAKGSIQQEMSLQHLSSGVYFLSLERDGKKESIKLIRQ